MEFTESDFKSAVDELLGRNDTCGSDGIFVSEFEEYWKLNGREIIDSLNSGTYRPGTVQQFDVLKKNGKKRILSKFTCTDRVILSVVKDRLTEAWKGKFSEHSYAYQENKGVREAVIQAAEYIGDGKGFVAEIDIKDYFDSINLERMESFIRKGIQDDELLSLIHRYLYVMLMDDTGKSRKTRGIVQGSPISPVLSNIYLSDFDRFMGERYCFCRFSDDINIYCSSEDEAEKAFGEAEEFLRSKLGLCINKGKSGIYSAINRRYLGYEFFRKSGDRRIYIRRASNDDVRYYNRWHPSAIQKIDRNYHIINDGILTKQDYTVLFENDDGKKYLPAETLSSINVYSNVTFSSSFFEYAASKRLRINIFDKYGEYIGNFCTSNHCDSTKTMLKQAEIYNDDKKRLAMAVSIETASLHNGRENLRYYYKHNKDERLNDAIKTMTTGISQMKNCKSIDELLLIEARAKQAYLKAFDVMINDPDFVFDKRTRRPPKNEVNAMMSFGNVFLYRRIATEIYKTPLDIRIGFAHAAGRRSESLNLDIAEIFKPVIVDRTIFQVIHKMEINVSEHFSRSDDGGVCLNREGKRVFIRALERKLYQKLTVDGMNRTYDTYIRAEVRKILNTVQTGEKYKPFKYT